ncbi:MAG: helix-turn-helix transcriptional regulator, partial [Clostridia bacterium]|nr:helix-turn-helix transcriptional regulator [Clostridia bacterium]
MRNEWRRSMSREIENFKIESVVHKNSNSFGEITNRKTHTFNIRVSGMVKYCFEDKTIVVKAGEMIYLPKGSTYTYQVVSECPSLCTIINIDGDFETIRVNNYSLDDFHYADSFMSNFADLWNFGSIAEKYKCMAYIYDLISFVYTVENMNYPDKKRFQVIEPAVNYLKKNIYNTSFKVEELHRLCGISHTYFSKLFIAKFGMSPKKYVVDKR